MTRPIVSGSAGKKPELREVFDPELAHTLSHPLRAHILAVLNERIASPNEIAKEVDIPVSDISYHARRLREEGHIRLVETRRRRGALEHFYEAVEPLIIDDDHWLRLPEAVRTQVNGRIFQWILGDMIDALEEGA